MPGPVFRQGRKPRPLYGRAYCLGRQGHTHSSDISDTSEDRLRKSGSAGWGTSLLTGRLTGRRNFQDSFLGLASNRIFLVETCWYQSACVRCCCPPV